MAYLYRHIRDDKNVPFYIGIGSSPNFSRVYSKEKRNVIWKRIVAKTTYTIEIIFPNVTAEVAKKKEIEFIKLYGRLNNGTGVLANMTDGGEGAVGVVLSAESRYKMGNGGRGRVISEETRMKLSIAQTGRKMPVRSLETLLKMSMAQKGKKVYNESKIKMSIARKKYFEDLKRRRLPGNPY